jgi:GrpB-like predicted nucleotidyltransferase (UPF0157 family)
MLGVAGMNPSAVIVVAYDPQWPAFYRAEAACLEALLGESLREIHHIGSTSVPGLGAKPIVDILVSVETEGEARQTLPLLAEEGYQHIPEFDNVLPGRFSVLRKRPEANQAYNLHIAQYRSDFVTRHLVFRDYLIAHPEARHDYETIKRIYAKYHPDSLDLYMTGKDPFIKAVLDRALLWQAQLTS